MLDFTSIINGYLDTTKQPPASALGQCQPILRWPDFHHDSPNLHRPWRTSIGNTADCQNPPFSTRKHLQRWGRFAWKSCLFPCVFFRFAHPGRRSSGMVGIPRVSQCHLLEAQDQPVSQIWWNALVILHGANGKTALKICREQTPIRPVATIMTEWMMMNNMDDFAHQRPSNLKIDHHSLSAVMAVNISTMLLLCYRCIVALSKGNRTNTPLFHAYCSIPRFLEHPKNCWKRASRASLFEHTPRGPAVSISSAANQSSLATS